MIDMSDINKMEEKIKNIIKNINSKNTFSDYNENTNNCKFCPYKTKCWEDTFKDDKEIVVNVILTDNRIKIETGKFLQNKIDKVLDNKLSYEIDNKYYVVKAMKQIGIDFDGMVHLYMNSSTYLGFKNYIIELLQTDLKEFLEKKGFKLNIKIIDERNIPNISANLKCKELNGIDLRDYQKNVVEKAIKEEITILGLCTSAGKTVIASEIIRILNYKTLFVVNTIDLLNQAKKTFEKTLGVKVGTITGGKAEWEGITVATIQTIIKYLKNEDNEFIKQLHECNLIIVDECHFSKAKSYSLLMENVKARYRFGLSATPYAYGNNSLEIYKSFGFPKINISLQDLIKLGYLTKPEIKFIKYEHKEHYFDYEDAYSGCLNSEERLNKLKEIVDNHKNDYILIIVRRINHADMIKELIGSDVEIIKGSISKKKREKLLNEMREGKRKILIGTDKIVSTGLDIPILNVLINYSANLTTIQTIQSLGRICRLHPNKDKAYYYDFYDTNEYLRKATKERINILKKQGFKVVIQ
jgi:superfamily II DNA or RNA helicase